MNCLSGSLAASCCSFLPWIFFHSINLFYFLFIKYNYNCSLVGFVKWVGVFPSSHEESIELRLQTSARGLRRVNHIFIGERAFFFHSDL